MMKLINNLLKLALYWFLGLIIATIIAAIILKPRWELISRLHRPGQSIVATSPELVVEDVDGTLFQSCGTNCWKEIGADDLLDTPGYITDDCGFGSSVPRIRDSISVKSECDEWYPAPTYRVYALNASGEIFQWEESHGWSFLDKYCFGLLFSLLIPLFGLIFMFAQGLTRIIYWIRSKVFNIHDEGNEEE